MGSYAQCWLDDLHTLGDSLVVRRLPYCEFLASYPTIGPSGLLYLDVNGMAASIELYLGPDVLRSDDTKYVPVQWTGYDKSAKQYQGEVLDKATLHDRFRSKLKVPDNLESEIWRDLRTVLEMIFGAFTEKIYLPIAGRIPCTLTVRRPVAWMKRSGIQVPAANR